MTSVLPSVYEFYASGGVSTGLDASKPYFTLNSRNITIYSGSLHYFRVPRDYWRDRLRKIRAAGLNAVETYVPWNLHEPQDGRYDFGSGGSDMQDFLHVAEFLRTAQEEDLLAIVRPGPYICAEFEFGGFPSWLLRHGGIQLRTSERTYMKLVSRYFNVLLPILAALQFTRGGPIIAFQVENEYGSTEKVGIFTPDRRYLRKLRRLYLEHGIVELLVTSDSPSSRGSIGTIPDLFLQTANFGRNPEIDFVALKLLQPNKPVMAMEFWTGWFDHWSEDHHRRSNSDFYSTYEKILKYPASVNMYMFHGGTSFGFLNGANLANSRNDNSGFQPDTTSYDYDAPLSESGDYTAKYAMVKSLLAKYNPIKTRTPRTPTISDKKEYPSTKIVERLAFDDIVRQSGSYFSENVVPMEMLPINNSSGQSYGYIVYRKTGVDVPANSIITIGGRICDTALVLINGILISRPLQNSIDLNGFGFWRWKNSKLLLAPRNFSHARIDIVVENWGRNNFGYVDQFNQYKGLWQGGVFLNDRELLGWEIVPLEFKKQWNANLKGWHSVYRKWTTGPCLYRTTVNITDAPRDTFVDMQKWTKGIVIVNNFVLGRYCRIGPQQTLYLPAPFLKMGNNDIVIFEHYLPHDEVDFSDHPVYVTRDATRNFF
ncbi:beta-galactosidase-1-like protein 2 [Cylas formicarius]|uniref:beta-galactosidase-1-like protein 2 n=1 Tax=Cylas formicarius TaxID=197179 RepID=UPI002958A38F|nr:beta-galactosidase-1-like protein 2 [Cylas formicarius]